jgi:hypothetical protein
MAGTCLTNCRVAIVTNTGSTENDLIFVDCSGNTITIFIESGTTSFINFCNTYPFSGNTIDDLKFSDFFKASSSYSFSSCCESSEVYTIYGNEKILSIDDALYGLEYIKSETGEIIDLQCTTVFNKLISKVLPPPTSNYVSAINGVEKYDEFGCEQCIEKHPCLKQCYGLLSCEGGYKMITSTDNSLSGYVDTFVYIDIDLPSPETPTTPFLVKDLGIIDCSTEYEFTVVSSAETCNCECYTFKTPSEPFLTTYVDCDYNLLEVYLPTGQTTSICSLVRPIFNIRRPFAIKLGGLCVNGDCPQPPAITIEPRNECDVLTIFPMGVDCIVTHPSTPYSYDGEASLSITGGTPPYEIVWGIGSVAPVITNLNVGEYTATVTDYYGDFIINTTCVLTGETTTTTSTTTIKPILTYGNLCVIFTLRSGSSTEPFQTTQVQLEYNDYFNGKPNWLSNDSQYNIYWSTGNTNNWVLSGYPSSYATIVNNTTSIPPLTGWQVLGAPEVYSLTVLSGDCSVNNIVGFNVTTNAAKCKNDGSIIIQAYGGSGVYEYSIDNGITYSPNPIFQNLQAGTYVIFVKDSNGTISIQTVVIQVQQVPAFGIALSANTNNNTFIIGSNLQPGYSIEFDLNHISNLSYYPSNLLPQPQYNNLVTVNGFGTLTQINTTNTTSVISLPCSNSPVIKSNGQKEYKNTFTLNYGQTITGYFTNSLTNQPTDPCSSASKNYQMFITNAKVTNCDCCPVKIQNPKTEISISKI